MKPFFKYAIVAAAASFVTFSAVTLYNSVSGALGLYTDVDKNMSLLSKITVINKCLEKNYLYDDYDTNKMNDEALKAYVSALDEPYTHYFPSDEFVSYLDSISDSYVGIGIIITSDSEADKIMVIAPMEGSPARDCGIMPGDYILAVDGTEFDGSQMDECVAAIKNGSVGTSVTLTMEQNGEIKDITVERREISAHSVNTEMLDNKIGYMRISAFNTNDYGSDTDTYTEFLSHIKELEADGMEKLIIDLRDNPGGIIDVVCDVADYLLPEGTITYTETRTGKKTVYSSDKNDLDIPMAVIINNNSASAAEILTGALKDYKKAYIVGQTSFGKGIVQTVYPFADGSGLSMTVAKYYTPNGVCIHGTGIQPDYEVSVAEKYQQDYAVNIPFDEDYQLQKAIELLK